MAAYPFFLTLTRITDENGDPVTPYLRITDAGTTNLATIYADHTTTPQENPLEGSDAGTFDNVFLAAGSYKIRVEDGLGNLLLPERDNYDVLNYDPDSNSARPRDRHLEPP